MDSEMSMELSNAKRGISTKAAPIFRT